jgi:alkanesulfonate monooxygenase SsuD/methylene tetrahydromethanopterin reductase-like flavin-dependent oxidoreductase (luciferase family)
MKFSIFDLMHSADFPEPCEGAKQIQLYEDHLEEWVLAEKLGFDTVFLAEHHFTDYSFMPSPNLMLAALAQRTKRIRMGSMINILPFYDPVRLAEECAMLDVLTQGRLTCGFGRGADYTEFDRFQIPMDEARARFQEGLEIIEKAWAEDVFSYDGNFYKYKNVSIRPRPIQSPRPLFFTPVSSPETHTWAAQKGYSITKTFSNAEKLGEDFRFFCAESEKYGRKVTGEDYLVCRSVYVTDSMEQAIEDLREPMLHFHHLFKEIAVPPTVEEFNKLPENYKIFKERHMVFLKGLPPIEEQLKHSDHYIVGDPETVLQELQRQQKLIGTEHFICNFTIGTLSHEKTVKSMKLFAEKVMPAFQ